MPDFAAIADVLMQPDRELWLLTAQAGPDRGGLIATFVSTASIVPECPRVLVGLARQHYTWRLVQASGAFMLHLLGEEHLDWVWRFGLCSGRDDDKLAGLAHVPGTTGAPRLTAALGWLDCQVEDTLDIGDRTIYVAEVRAGRLEKTAPLLTMKRLLALAPPEQLRELREALQRDAAVDAAAIARWRMTPPS
jgi:flavin reductase (DIM6/NTAB) family NADH-FMN oxidoreductase RutF